MLSALHIPVETVRDYPKIDLEIKMKTSQVVSLAMDMWERYWGGLANVDMISFLEKSSSGFKYTQGVFFSVEVDPKTNHGYFTCPLIYKQSAMKRNIGLAHMLGRYVLRQELPYVCTYEECLLTDFRPTDTFFNTIKGLWYRYIKRQPKPADPVVKERYLQILCNIFAIGLLVPQPVFKQAFDKKTPTSKMIANFFEVPVELVERFF